MEHVEYHAITSTEFTDSMPVMVGIDEAGRGPVLGPMVYGTAFWPIAWKATLDGEGYDDSKVLKESLRQSLFQRIQNDTRVGWTIRSISAEEISHNMQTQLSNLNELAREATVAMIAKIIKMGINVKEVYVDTIGDPGWYEHYLTRKFASTIQFTVAKKADSLYKVVSAASICAKVTRDTLMANWEWDEKHLVLSKEFGSGYPSDPRTKEWLNTSMDPVFGYPRIVRFSWSTTATQLEKGHAVKWHFEREEEKKELNAQPITAFFGKQKETKRVQRAPFFEKCNLQHVTTF